jgi:hypothetical protein
MLTHLFVKTIAELSNAFLYLLKPAALLLSVSLCNKHRGELRRSVWSI